MPSLSASPVLGRPLQMQMSSHNARKRSKQEVCEAFIKNLLERGDVNVEQPGFLDGVRAHFEKLPTRYSLDVNIESLDVLSHKRLLDEARADRSTVSFSVRPVEIMVLTRATRESTDGPNSPTRVSARPALLDDLSRRHACADAVPSVCRRRRGGRSNGQSPGPPSDPPRTCR